MHLDLFKRDAPNKSDASKLRREGKIPAVIYQKGKDSEPIAIDANQLKSVLRTVQPGRLPTTVLSLKGQSGAARRVIIKDLQYHITTYEVTHLDFEELHDNQPVNVKVPIECTGVVDCVGIKLGGFLRQVIRHLRVRCLPKDIPAVFEVDIKDLGLQQACRLKDLNIPQSIRPLANLNEIAVVIVRR